VFSQPTELNHINQLAICAGVNARSVPFLNVERLPKDNGEQFFSGYLSWTRKTKPRFDEHDNCLCQICGGIQNKINNLPQHIPTALKLANDTNTAVNLASIAPQQQAANAQLTPNNNNIVRAPSQQQQPPPLRQQQQQHHPMIITPQTFWPAPTFNPLMNPWMPTFMPFPTAPQRP